MATAKKYYWMKLKESFMTSDTIDFFMSQPNGANYVVLYQMLCLKTINTGGRLSRQIGEVIIPYDIPKIQRDCKYFTADTIRVALEMYKAFGLIYEDVDGTLVMADHENLVGSETGYAVQKRLQRQNSEKAELLSGGHSEDNPVDNVHPEIRDRDKRLDIRDRDKSIEKEVEVTASDKAVCCTPEEMQRIASAWNKLGLQQVSKISASTNRGKMLQARIREHGIDSVLNTIESIRHSSFLMGQNKRGWMITFDWFVKPNNFIKVMEGNYTDRSKQGNTATGTNGEDLVAQLKRAQEMI